MRGLSREEREIVASCACDSMEEIGSDADHVLLEDRGLICRVTEFETDPDGVEYEVDYWYATELGLLALRVCT